MPALTTFDSIATVTASGSTSFMTFTSISQSYTDLFLVISARSSTGANNDGFGIQVNASGSIYSDLYLRGDGASTFTGRNTNSNGVLLGSVPAASATSNIFGASVVHIPNYTSTSMWKSVLAKTGFDRNGAGLVEWTTGVARTTSAITRLDVFMSSGANVAANSTATLYGITRA